MYYLDLFQALEREQVRYLLIGGLALNIHGVERATMDVDVMIAVDENNVSAFVRAMAALEMNPLAPVPLKSLADPEQRQNWITHKHMVAFALQGRDPMAPVLDVLITQPVDFEQAWARRLERQLGQTALQLAHVDDLIAMKSQTGRERDKADIAALEKLKRLGMG